MNVRCVECGGSTAWDDEAGSAICTTCGTLTDPSQSILTSHLDLPHNTNFDGLWDPAAPTTLKSFRTGCNWDLPGQGNDAKDRKNNVRFSSPF
jgi:transcription factor IIIB subunit 2